MVNSVNSPLGEYHITTATKILQVFPHQVHAEQTLTVLMERYVNSASVIPGIEAPVQKS